MTKNRIREEWEKEFDKLPMDYPTHCWKCRKTILDFIDELLKSQREEFSKEQHGVEAHETENGYCCACEYDIACFEGKLKSQKESWVEKGNELIKKNDPYDSRGDAVGLSYNRAIEDYQNLIKEE